ncbi:MAG: NAD-dependent epimerase [Myxococcales bacterium]|nr:NAD-dependent epimerase [Myxococcales bacterium]
MARIFVTGVAGFIGYHLSLRLLERGDEVIGLDNVNAYYDVRLKDARLEQLLSHPRFQFYRNDLCEKDAVASIFAQHKPEYVVHLAAQAGVRHSLLDPYTYIDSNMMGFLHILEGCRHHPVNHLLYASSSSVYGMNTAMPFSEHHDVSHPVSLYAATKRANELMAHSYSHLYKIPTSGLRFFTVYGPWGRPDMALFLFTRLILSGKPIQVFNYGDMQRDFTYVGDIVEGIVRLLDHPSQPNPNFSTETPDPATSSAPYRIFNIGNNQPVRLMEMIEALEESLGRKAEKELLPIQPGDVPATYADANALAEVTGFQPATSIQEGVQRFVSWYLDFYADDPEMMGISAK